MSNLTTNRFARGSGMYACRCCGRNTRSTGRGDNEHARLCVECFELAGYENLLTDQGELSVDEASYVLGMIGSLAEHKDADLSNWDELKAEATRYAASQD